MKCFNHPDQDAVGLCKHCSKGLCVECASDLGHGLACKGSHERQVEDIDMLITRNTAIQTSAPKTTLTAPIFYLFTGIVFAGFGYFSTGRITNFPVVLGAGFIVFGVITFVQSRRLFGNAE